MTRVPASAAFMLVALLPAGVRAQTARVHDSAGVRITDNASIATLPLRFQLAAKPDIVVGGLRDKPEDELNPRISYPGAIRLPGNRMLVPDGDQLKVFDATGHLVMKMGRAGAGPGEFRTTQGVCRFRGDSILAWDVGNRRISIWSPDGKLAREFTPAGFAEVGGCLNDGSIVVDGERVTSPREDLALAKFLVVSGTGTTSATFGPLPARFYSGSILRELKIGAHGDRFYWGDGVALGARILDRTGKVIGIFRTADHPDPITEASLNTHPMACVGNPVTKVCTPEPTKATTWPAYYRFDVDDNGRVWERLNMSGQDSVWIAFDSTGKTIGKLVIPPADKTARPQIIRFGKDEVILADLDDNGARRLSIFKLIPIGSR